MALEAPCRVDLTALRVTVLRIVGNARDEQSLESVLIPEFPTEPVRETAIVPNMNYLFSSAKLPPRMVSRLQ
jgi:hypothetical protein